NSYRKIQAGDYLISSQMSIHQILKILTNGETAKEKITIVEGWDIEEIGDYLESKNICTKQEFIDSANDSKWIQEFSFLKDKPQELNLEGYIFPDTYYLNKKVAADEIVETALKKLESELDNKTLEDIEKENKTIFEIVTMASMIEKEVKTLEDKRLVSGVLWNRLEIGMPLQVDATVIYAMGQEKEKVYTKDTKIDSPYNTYKYRGLPLGPISNPGIDSINAAIFPTQSNYLYYLSADNGKTIFSKTLEEHNYNKSKYLK
ncbi:MAG: endolytic transglycosylase MltG, partial [Candidatus Pacebacteria bacterium]|nr:endolytic transglycosylase MltG [Candidatus Paceibacterota bacterium]